MELPQHSLNELIYYYHLFASPFQGGITSDTWRRISQILNEKTGKDYSPNFCRSQLIEAMEKFNDGNRSSAVVCNENTLQQTYVFTSDDAIGDNPSLFFEDVLLEVASETSQDPNDVVEEFNSIKTVRNEIEHVDDISDGENCEDNSVFSSGRDDSESSSTATETSNEKAVIPHNPPKRRRRSKTQLKWKQLRWNPEMDQSLISIYRKLSRKNGEFDTRKWKLVAGKLNNLFDTEVAFTVGKCTYRFEALMKKFPEKFVD